MAMIATLNATENGYAGSAHSLASIPLNKLTAWDGNVRRTGASDNLGELTASIAANGVLQSLVVKKTTRGKYSIIAGRRRFLALTALAEGGTIAHDAPVPCRIMPGSADSTEISLTENVVRAPMHPADQFTAFRDLIDNGSSVADIAARFGISESAVRKRLKLARVSPVVFEAYRQGELTLEQVQAFAVSDDHAAQEQVLSELSRRSDDPDDIRSALTQDEIPGTDRRARFVTTAVYEEAGGAIRRDLFAEGHDGVFFLDAPLLDRLALEKLERGAVDVRAEGWKWVEAELDSDYESRAQFRTVRPEPLPMKEEEQAEHKRLAEEYHNLFESMEEHDEETSERLDAIEARMNELEDTEEAFSPETLFIAGAIVTVGDDGELEVVRGLVRPEDLPEDAATPRQSKAKPPISASLMESLTAQKSAAISASLIERPDIALVAVVHCLASRIFGGRSDECSLQLTAKPIQLREECEGLTAMEQARERWGERVPGNPAQMWEWCLAQTQDTLLELLAFCTASAIDAVQRNHDEPDDRRILHANALATALNLDMKAWFTPTKDNYFGRIGKPEIISAICEAKNVPAKRSWEKLKKSELAALAERETAGSGWLPQPLRA